MPVPASRGMVSASHTSRSACRGRSSTCRLRPSLVSGPRTGAKPAPDPSWAVTSATTRSLAVAVQHRTGHPARQQVEHPDQAAVVGAEVVAPVGDAVGLVDHQQPAAAADLGQDVGPELGVGQPLGRDEEDVDAALVEPLGDAVPLVAVGAVDGDRPHAHALGGLDLVAHEGEQGRHEQGGSAATVAEHAGGDEVHRALAPTRPLHQQHPLALATRRRMTSSWSGRKVLAGSPVNRRSRPRASSSSAASVAFSSSVVDSPMPCQCGPGV